jgi:hypothetical protein
VLTDSDYVRKRKITQRRGIKSQKWWSDQQKIEAVQMYLLLGNLKEVERQLRIPYVTLNSWKVSEWWKEITETLKSQESIVFGNKLKGIVEQGLAAVSDRLANGDWIYDQKTGELRRKPVAMKDALKVATDLIDKQQKLERPDHAQVAQEGVMERLEKLAKTFEEFATRKVDNERPTINVTDVIFGKEEQNALPEEREEGLQDGVPEVPQQARTEDEQGGEEPSPA